MELPPTTPVLNKKRNYSPEEASNHDSDSDDDIIFISFNNDQLPTPLSQSKSPLIQSKSPPIHCREVSPTPGACSSNDHPSSRKKMKLSNSTPRSPFFLNGFVIELKDLIKAGTIHLPYHTLETEDNEELDEWKVLTPHLLEMSLSEKDKANLKQDDRICLPTPSSSPDKGKAKAYSQDDPDLVAPVDLIPTLPTLDEDIALLQKILKLQNHFILVATAREAITGVGTILRVYLVPDDYDFEDEQIEEIRWNKKRPSTGNLARVLERVLLESDAWEKGIAEEGKELLEESDTRSLLEIYQSIKSPPSLLEFVHELTGISTSTKHRLQTSLTMNPPGLRTELYAYQKDSLTRMLTREIAPQDLPDPTYRPMLSVDSETNYYLSSDYEPVLAPPTYQEPRGGILAEEMGIGKTAICIGLVLSTLGELPILEETPTESSPILMTTLSTNFPFRQYTDEIFKLRPRVPDFLYNSRTMMGDLEIAKLEARLHQQKEEDDIALKVKLPLPSLSNLLVNYIKTSGNRICTQSNYLESISVKLPPLISDALNKNVPYYYLHPPEVKKESRAGRREEISAVKIIVTSTTIVVVPPILLKQWIAEIRKHTDDTVVGSKLRVLVLRDSRNKFPERAEDYTKYDIILMSVSKFSSAAEEVVGNGEQSWLRRVHFKRLIIDEGHALGNNNASKMRTLASELRCESKWIVSGTPTRNLVGIDPSKEIDFTNSSSDFTVEGGDKGDFDRLANLFSRILHHPAYPSPQTWMKLYTGKFHNCPQLEIALNAAIVRSQPGKVAESFVLPPLTTRVVRLQMEEAERLTYNCLLAMFVANAIACQREDEDYMFHKGNKAMLDRLVSNLNQGSTFFSSHEILSHLDDSLKYCRTFFRSTEGESKSAVRSRRALTWTEDDRNSLLEVISIYEEASRDTEWTQTHTTVAPQIEVFSMNPEISKSFDGLLESEESKVKRTLWSIGALVNLKTTVVHLATESTSELDGEDFEEEVITHQQKKKWDLINKVVAEVEPKKKRKIIAPVRFPLGSSLLGVRLGATTSSKANYIIDKVLAKPSEKFLIFVSSHPDNLIAFISEAFDLVRIRYVILAGGLRSTGNKALSSQDSASKASRFSSSSPQECQVCLLSVTYAARGLHLPFATQVIFLEPIWKKDLEMQAVKRAHRLGQTEPVEVEILIIEDSFEDTLYKRREELKPSELSKTSTPQRDSKLQEVLQSSKYLEAPQFRIKSTRSTPLFKQVVDPSSLSDDDDDDEDEDEDENV